MNIATKITGQQFVKLSNKVITCPKVIFTQCMDIHPFSKGPIFDHARYVYLDGCNKNFVYYWLNRKTFPNVQKIYLNSHPCQSNVLHRFAKYKANDYVTMVGIYDQRYAIPIVLSDNYERYKTRWFKELNNVSTMSNDKMIAEFESL